MAFLPANEIPAQFEAIVENCPATLTADFNRLVDYYRAYWVPRASLGSVHGLVKRTNTSVEGWNARFNRQVETNHHPGFWVFLKALVTEQVDQGRLFKQS